MNHDLADYLEGFVTDERRLSMDRVLAERTRYVTLLVEDVYQPHNASAVLRSCDAFGVQDVHIVENRNRYRINPGVELGTSKWLTLHRYNQAKENTSVAARRLKETGYRLVATLPTEDATPLDRLDLTAGPVAILLGNELDGLSATALELADERLTIPMHGFVESFNISVSAAIILYHLTQELRLSTIDFRLRPEERLEVRLEWLRRSIGRSEALERRFHQTASPGERSPEEAS